MATYIHGKKAAFVHGSINLSPWMSEATASIALESADTSHFSTEAKTYIVGQNDGTFSGSGLYDGTIGGVQEYMEAIIATETSNGAPPPITFAPEGLIIGGAAVMALAKLSNYEVNPVVSDVVKMSFETQATGGFTIGSVIYTPAAVSATTAGTSIDNTTATTAGGRVFVHVLSNANSGNVTAALQHSTNNSTWVDLATLPVVATGTLTAFRTLEFAGTVNRYLRLNLTLAGTGAVSVTASVARN